MTRDLAALILLANEGVRQFSNGTKMLPRDILNNALATAKAAYQKDPGAPARVGLYLDKLVRAESAPAHQSTRRLAVAAMAAAYMTAAEESLAPDILRWLQEQFNVPPVDDETLTDAVTATVRQLIKEIEA